MSQPASARTQSFKLISTFHKPNLSREQVIETVYTVFAFTITILLVCLGLRVVCALLVISNPPLEGLTKLTDLFVLPFSRIFHDQHDMVQISTAFSFTAYYLLYWIVAFGSRFFRPTTRSSAAQYSAQ